MTLKVASVEPDFLKAKLGKTTIYDGGQLTKTGLSIEIPAGEFQKKAAAKSTVEGSGKSGEIILETAQPPIHSLRIRIRFSLQGGN